MAARSTKTKSKRSRSVEKKTVETPNEVSVSKSRLTNKQKLLVAGGVLLAGFLIFSGKQLFVAATVNGSPVSRLEVIRELEKQGGQQVLDTLVNEKIIIQEARKANIQASDEEVNAKIDEFKEQLSAQGQNYETVLEMEGISQDEFRRQIEIQIYLEKILADRVEVTDEDINAFLETNSDYLPEDMSEEEKRETAREQLSQQKLSTEFSTWLQDVRANADINYFIEY